MTTRTALLLAAHGSTRDPAAAALVERLGEALRSRRLADEVTTAYHQGTPGFAAALDRLTADRVVVLPLFTSVGYYTEQVLPTALRASERFTAVALRQASPLGTHPALVGLIGRRIDALAAHHGLRPSACGVLVVGHGTRRHPHSRDATLALVEGLRREEVVGSIATGFLDDDPSIEAALAELRQPDVLVIPFLLGGRGHAATDLPARLRPGPGQRILLDEPLGGQEALVDLLAETARRELARFDLPAGTVALVGAGPGDPELITRRGLRLLRAADVVLHDRLVAPELLLEARADALIIDVGKSPGAGASSQRAINASLVHHARLGRSVVRLKGGDPFVFGRGAEEFEACEAAGIPCSVVPGISSAIAAPAAAGIPVTSRGESRSFAVVTAQGENGGLPDSFARLAPALSALDTVVILMGRAVLSEITSALISAGRDPGTPAACIQEGTTPSQRVTVATLGTIAEAADRDGLVAPIVTVIGAVATHAHAARAVALQATGAATC